MLPPKTRYDEIKMEQKVMKEEEELVKVCEMEEELEMKKNFIGVDKIRTA